MSPTPTPTPISPELVQKHSPMTMDDSSIGLGHGPSNTQSQGDEIGRAIDRSHSMPNLLGDRTTSLILPILPSAVAVNQDLHEIAPETLGQLINGKFAEEVNSFLIVDCRYPYEYEGGHIQGALNLVTEKQLWAKLFDGKDPKVGSSSTFGELEPQIENETRKRDIIIFHCEFSKERGPRMCRSLRTWDRKVHYHCFPTLHYPELYVLSRGYRKFFATHPELCSPSTYRRMDHPDFVEEFKLWKRTCKGERIATKLIGTSAMASSSSSPGSSSLKKRKMAFGQSTEQPKVSFSVKKFML